MPLASDPTVRTEKLNIYNRKRVRIANALVRRADFISDAGGEVRFAQGAGYDNVSKLDYRDGRNQDWRLVNDEDVSGHREFALGFSPDGALAYLQVERDDGPDLLMSWDPLTGKYTELLHDPVVDPYRILYDLDGRTPIGATYMSDRVYQRFFDDNAPTARL